ncbi:sensor histidine kinase [Shinella sp. BYT-45]|uniref:sensor histidine kinase n=1 Tax=Shinella sp. BYT-45 TaxID=3377377 RepID=UPI0039813841
MAAIGFAAFLLAAIAALAALMTWQSYSAALRAGEAKATSSAQIVAAHLEWMIEASDQALRRIDSALADDPVGVSAGAIADIRQAVGDLPEGFQYSVYDETGRLRLSSVPEAIGIDVSDREYFQRLKAGEMVVISPQLEERLSGEQVFVIARRISRANAFHGAASIAIPTRTMDEFWSAMELGPHSTVSAIRTDGWLIARHPQLDRSMDFSGTPLFADYLPRQPSGFYHSSASPADGISRIVGYRKVENWPLVATTGVERGEALEYFRSSLLGGLVIGVPTVAVMVLGTLWIASLLRRDGMRRAQLEQALERNAFLLREIHHRVKNNLQAVASLLRMQPLPEESKADMSRRIAAMIAVHEQIYESDQFDQLELAPYVERLVREIAKGFPGNVDIELKLEPVRVERDHGLPIGLIVNEVVSNAFKYAFDKRQGHLSVRLTADGGRARLVFKDDGPGYSPETARKGMGSKLVGGFAAQIGGTLDIDASAGTTVSMTFPASG